ncbi:hypothetical protein OG889_06805 [Streptomyces sp. NBC_00481]|uniref:hypothetical protein n=1 Tax=Streptomyces sp. NBC_00481 TaxID=2975755 RepID=UPI002DDC84D8|nr:hypothetical protein [Streptomyces sp. NBC_00481]WRY94450.1 hypothetical protein OG889_06805 [Streptomyces sp. NBC_00481]
MTRTQVQAHHRTRAMRAVHALGVAALCLTGPALAACSATAGSDAADRSGEVLDWDDKATPATVSRQMNLDLPANATDKRAARQNGFQDDGLLLVFTLPTSGVDGFVERLGPESELRQRDEPRESVAKPMTPFSHLGLPEPESLPDVREGQVCAPCDGDLNSLAIAMHRLDDGKSRVYLRAVD